MSGGGDGDARATPDTLRQLAEGWSLAGDRELLRLLENIHQNVMEKCSHANSQLEQMSTSLDVAAVCLRNVTNRFSSLGNTQFVESRVYDDDVTTPVAASMSVEQATPASAEVDTDSIMATLSQYYVEPAVPVRLDSDSYSDDEDVSTVLKPRSLYEHRPLPDLIGTEEWSQRWHIGLLPDGAEPSRREVERVRERADYSSLDDDEPLYRDRVVRPQDSYSVDSVVSEESSTRSADVPSRPAVPTALPVKPTASDLIAEIARRRAGTGVVTIAGNPSISSEPQVTQVSPTTFKQQVPTTLSDARVAREPYKNSEPNAFARKDTRKTPVKDIFADRLPQSRLTSNIFPDEPPPMDDTIDDQSDDDDIFADLHKQDTKNIFNTNATQYGGLFDDVAPGYDRNRNESQKDIFDDLMDDNSNVKTKNVNKEVSTVQAVKGLFDDDDDDLFDDIIKTKPVAVKAVLPSKASVKGLFDSDEEDDFFTERIKPPELDKHDDVMNVSKIDDEKSNDIHDKVSTKNPVGGVSLFGSQNTASIGAAIMRHRQISSSDEDDFEESRRAKNIYKPNKTDERSNRDSDDDYDELFSPESNPNKKFDDLFAKSIERNKKSEENKEKDNTHLEKNFSRKQDNLFTDIKHGVQNMSNEIDDLFANSTKVESKKNPEIKSDKEIDKSLFSQNIFNDDLFSTKSTSKTKEIEITSDETKHLFDDNNLFSNDMKQKDIPKNKNFPSTSLFDDENDDDIFTGLKIKSRVTTNDITSNNFSGIENNYTAIAKSTNKSSTEYISENLSTSSTKFKENVNEYEPYTQIEDEVDKPELNTPISHSPSEYIDRIDPKQTISSKIIDQTDAFNKSSDDNSHDDNTIDELFINSVIKTSSDKLPKINDNLHTEDNQTDQSNNLSMLQDQSVMPKFFSSSTHNETIDHSENKLLIGPKSEISDKLLSKHSIDAIQSESPVEVNIKYDNINETPVKEKTSDDAMVNTIESNPVDDFFNTVFSDQPPDFEKPNTPKKNQDVNALFGDDSDDEGLFLKKHDNLSTHSDDSRSLDDFIPPNDDKLFRLFHSEVAELSTQDNVLPRRDMKVKEKVEEKCAVKPQIVKEPGESFEDLEYVKIIRNNQGEKIEEVISPSKPDHNLVKENYPDCSHSIINKEETCKITDLTPNSEAEDIKVKPVGKLKPMNVNINVQGLLPGQSPIKFRKPEVMGDSGSKINDDTDSENYSNVKSELLVHHDVVDNSRPAMTKSVSFDKKPDSPSLVNTFSKDRVKIQVKRRPSSRKARIDAVRNSAIFPEDDLSTTVDAVDAKSETMDRMCSPYGQNPTSDSNTEINSNTKVETGKLNTLGKLYSNLESVKNNEMSNSQNKPSICHEKSDFKSPAEENLFKSLTEPSDLYNETKEAPITKLHKSSIFETEENGIDDLFNTNAKIQTTKEIYSKDKVALSNDNLFDSIVTKGPNFQKSSHFSNNEQDHFGNDPVLPSNKQSLSNNTKVQANISDDVDDNMFKIQTKLSATANRSSAGCSTGSTVEDEKLERQNANEPKSVFKTSIFDFSDDETFTSSTNKSKDLATSETGMSKSVVSIFDDEKIDANRTKTAKVVSKSKLFDDDSDDDALFGVPARMHKLRETKIENVHEGKLFSDNDDLFKNNDTIKSVPKVVENKSLFGDDSDDDIFGERKTSTGSLKTKPLKNPEASHRENSSAEEVFRDPLSFFD